MKQVYSLEHALSEDPVYISKWLEEHNLPVHHIRLFNGDSLPDPSQVGLLIVMGGPMNVYDEELFPWLVPEKKFIRSVIDQDVPVLGICLGGQLISEILGGSVVQSPKPEYGWHVIERKPEFYECLSSLGRIKIECLFPLFIQVFQWHQDTFSIPPGATHLYFSPTCQNQAYIYNDRVIGLQFHPEMDRSAIIGFLKESAEEIRIKSLSKVQDSIMSHLYLCTHGHRFIAGVLEYLIGLSKT